MNDDVRRIARLIVERAVNQLRSGERCEQARIELANPGGFRDGRCVFGENSPALAAFRAILPSRYADLKRVRSGAEAALAARVARGS